jgi:hypothetical protein
MANMNSKVKFTVDKDPSVTLRASSAAQITATASETGISLNPGTAYWNIGNIPLQPFAVNVLVKTIDRTTGDETYTITVEVATTLGGSYTVVGTLAALTTAGVYTLILDMDRVLKQVPSAAFIRITATLGGTTPILDYDAYLAPVVGA